jgi:hypothetical protein
LKLIIGMPRRGLVIDHVKVLTRPVPVVPEEIEREQA